MALQVKNSGLASEQDPSSLPVPHGRRSRRKSSEAADERSLISPLTLRRPGPRIIYWAIFVCLVFSTVITLGPVYWMFSGGLKSSSELYQTPPTIWAQHPLWSNFTQAWTVMGLQLYFANTLILAAGAVVLQVVVSATAAYALSKLRPAGGNIIQFGFFCTLMVPPVAYLIPQFVNVNDIPFLHISLFNSWAGVWLPEAANPFNILILKSFFDGIPNDLTDAARLDGASSWRIFTSIVVPLSQPVLAVVTIFTIVATWKDFLWPLLVLADPSVQSLQVALYHLQQPNANLPFNYLIASLALASIPPIVLFLFFQKQIIRGISLTGLKG
ncbi:ABC transporter permease [Ktedonobacteria bacterium brp13]|nr:ABC transporter permease [Ktedonobacteria bacterium brp13]